MGRGVAWAQGQYGEMSKPFSSSKQSTASWKLTVATAIGNAVPIKSLVLRVPRSWNLMPRILWAIPINAAGTKFLGKNA